MIELALEHARRGFPVVPLHPPRQKPDGSFVCGCYRADCSSPAKHPRTRNGLSDASTDPAQIATWWRHEPEANIGVITGRAIVLDIDPRHGGDESIAALESLHGALPETWRALTGGGGEHVFFEPPPGHELRNSANLLGQGLDIRGVGGYVVGAGSRHISGGIYAWNVDHHPDDVPLAPTPEWLVGRLRKAQREGRAQGVEKWRTLTAHGAENGGRNNAVAQLSGHLLRRYVDPIVTLELVQAWNAARCRPPLTEDEVAKTVASICRKEQCRQKATRVGR